jgi:hypothetical protein
MSYIAPSSEVWAEEWLASTEAICDQLPQIYKDDPTSFYADQAGDLPTDQQLPMVIQEIKNHSRYQEISNKLNTTFGLTLNQYFKEYP